MQLNISFSDGTKKIINLTPNFFMEKTTTEINKKAKAINNKERILPTKLFSHNSRTTDYSLSSEIMVVLWIL